MAKKQAKAKQKGKRLTADELETFIKVWNKAESKQDAATTLGMTMNKISVLSYRLRKRSVPLQKFKGGGSSNIDYSALVAVGKSTLKQKNA